MEEFTELPLLLDTIMYEIKKTYKRKRRNTLNILSICSGIANYELEFILKLYQNKYKHINLILYDIIYDNVIDTEINYIDKILSKFPFQVQIHFCCNIDEIVCILPEKLHIILGFNIQEVYQIPRQYLTNVAEYKQYITREKEKKSMLSLCNKLIQKYNNIQNVLFYIFVSNYGENNNENSVKLTYNDFGEFYINRINKS